MKIALLDVFMAKGVLVIGGAMRTNLNDDKQIDQRRDKGWVSEPRHGKPTQQLDVYHFPILMQSERTLH